MVLQIPYVIKLLLGTEVCPDSVYVSALECTGVCYSRPYMPTSTLPLHTEAEKACQKWGGGSVFMKILNTPLS